VFRKNLYSVIIVFSLAALSPFFAQADGIEDSSAQSLLKEMKNRYLDQNGQTGSPTVLASPATGLPPPPSSPTIPPMRGASVGSSSSDAPQLSASTTPDLSHTLLLISSDPSGAKIQIDGALIGDTPVSFQAHAGMFGSICVLKDGYYRSAFLSSFRAERLSEQGLPWKEYPPRIHLPHNEAE